MKTYLLKFRWPLVLSIFFLFILSESGYPQEEEIAKYPSRPITFIHPFTAGTPTDSAIRLITREAEKFLGQPIVVVNKAGGSGSVGVAGIASSKPDGYTIGNTPASTVLVVPLLEKVPYHPIKDLRMIMQFGGFNIGVFVKTDSPFKSFKDIIDFGRLHPKKVSHGTAGATSMQYLIMERILMKEKVQFTLIPFGSAAQTTTALLGGHILIGSGDFSYSLLEAGEIRVLLLFNDEPSIEYPDIPILKDLGYDFSAPYYACVAGPRGLPEGIAKKLEDAFNRAMKQPAFIKGMKDIRVPIVYRNSRELGDYVAHNYEVFSKLFKEIGLTK